MSLEIQGSLSHLSLQGAQDSSHRRFGVPLGGAFDQELWKLANAVVGNGTPLATLEIAFSGFKATVLNDCRISVLGAAFQVDGQQVLGCLSHVLRGQELSVGVPYGARAYLAAHGGWLSFEQGRLSSGASIASQLVAHSVSVPERPKRLRVIPFGSSQPLDGASFTVSSRLDRVGIRLQGEQIQAQSNLVSEPTCFGAIQATTDGQLIILGPDGPTVGGYATQAVVCTADLDLLAQLRPGDRFRFQSIELEEARRLGAAKQNALVERIEILLKSHI